MGRLQDGELTPEEAEAKAQSLGIPRLNKAILIPKDTTDAGAAGRCSPLSRPLRPCLAGVCLANVDPSPLPRVERFVSTANTIQDCGDAVCIIGGGPAACAWPAR